MATTITVDWLGPRRLFGGKIVVDADGLTLSFRGASDRMFAWEEVRRLSFDDPGRTKSNVGSLVLFGVLGVGSRKTFTLLILSVPEDDYYFEVAAPVAACRTLAVRLADDFPGTAEKWYVNGEPVVSPASAGDAPADIIDQIRRLGQLRADGLLTDVEYEAKKAELLGRL